MAHTKQPKAAIMRALSKVGRAAAAAARTSGSQKKEVDPFATDEAKIKELRVQRENFLPVVRYDFIDALFRAFDAEKNTVAILASSCTALLKRAEEAEVEVKRLIPALADAEDESSALRIEIAKLKAIVADPTGQFGEPSVQSEEELVADDKELASAPAVEEPGTQSV